MRVQGAIVAPISLAQRATQPRQCWTQMLTRPAIGFFCNALMCIAAPIVLAQSPAVDLNDGSARLAAARATNGLNGDELKPWHLKASYEVFDPYGKALGSGTFEEWWAAKDKWKRSYSGSHYTGTEFHLPEGYAGEGEPWKPVPWPESLIAKKLLSPVDKMAEPTTFTNAKGQFQTAAPVKLAVQQLPNSKPPLACVSPTTDINRSVPGMGSTYCFERDGVSLRLSQVADFTSIYNKLGIFQGHSVGQEIAVRINNHSVVNIHTESLAIFDPANADIFTPKGPVTPVKPAAVGVESSVIAGKRISGDNPTYPTLAKMDREQGVVVIGATINRQGALDKLEVLESPSELLSGAALAAVRKWKYQPYLLNGETVEVETTINVNFNLGR